MVNAGRGRPALILTTIVALVVTTFVAAGPARAAVGATSKYVPFGPVRVVDTRNGPHPAVGATPADNTSVPIRVAGLGGLPASGMTAVVLNVTVTNTTGPGFVQVFPTGQAAIGSSSNMNVGNAGQIMSTLVVVPVGDGGRISIYQQKRADLVVDVFGYFTATDASRAGRYKALTPARIVDSRTGVGLARAGKLGTQDTRVVQVTGRGGVPASGVNAVALNLTVTETNTSGYLTATPNGSVQGVSNLNYDRPGTTRANFAIVPVDGNGRIRLYTHTHAHVLVDVAGWFSDSTASSSSEGLFVPVTPGRVLDTRAGAKPGAFATVPVTVAGRLGLGSDVGAVMASLTATESSASGFVTAWPSGQIRPGTSNLNVEVPLQTVANAAIVGVGGGAFDLYTHQGAHLVADISGYFRTSAPSTGSTLRWAYWGHLYADGKYNASDDTWTWNQTPYHFAESKARFEQSAAANGLQVRARDNGAYVTLTKPHPPMPDMRGRPRAEVQAFLGAIIEDEGDPCGLITDDPDKAHVEYIGQLLTQLGVTHRLTSGGGGFWSLRADRASFPEIQSWPYATTARTPGLGNVPCQ